LQELEETKYWLDLLVDAEIMKRELLSELMNESDELIAMLVSGVKTIKRNKSQ